MEDKLISIILPVYKVEQYIAKCIKSILNQTYINFELLIINDGTPDKSIEIAKQFKDSRIKIFNKINGGISDARNYGIKKAKGEYVYFLDSDDWIEPILLENCLKAIEKYESNFIVFGYSVDRENLTGTLISSEIISHKEEIFDRTQRNHFFEKGSLRLMGYVWNKFYKLSFINENQLRFNNDISLYEDVVFNAGIYEFSDKIVIIKDVLYHYVDRPIVSLIKKYNLNSFVMTIEMFNGLQKFLTAWEVEEKYKNELLAESLVTGIKHSINGLFSYKNNLSLNNKLKILKSIVNHKLTINYVKYYKPSTFKSKVYRELITTKSIFIIYFLFKVIK